MTSRERILRWLLRSYPKAFHDAYREDLLEFFEEQHSDPRYRRTFGELRFYGVVINPLPYPEADRLLTMWHTAPGADIARLGLSFGTYHHYKEAQPHVSMRWPRTSRRRSNLTGAGEPRRAAAANVTASFFDIFQEPVLGRGISVEEDQPGGNAVVMSDRLWRRRYGAGPSILNRSILLDGRSYGSDRSHAAGV